MDEMEPPGARHKQFTRTNIYSYGTEFELELFGYCADFPGRPPRINFRNAVMQAFTAQPVGWNPYNPSTEWSHLTIENVRSYMPYHMARFTGLFLSLGSALDLYHGIDAFFAYDTCIVTFDITSESMYTMRKWHKHCDFVVHRPIQYGLVWDQNCKSVAELLMYRHREGKHLSTGRRVTSKST